MDILLMDMGLDTSIIAAIHDMLEFWEESTERPHPPLRAFVHDNKAMKATAADILKYPQRLRLHRGLVRSEDRPDPVQIEDCNVLTLTGERRKEKEKEQKEKVKYVRMERRQGKFMKRFELPENANTDTISVTSQDGLLTITVEKRTPLGPKKAKTIEVKVGQAQEVVEDSPESPPDS